MGNSYRDLTVWQRSIDFTVKVYERTHSFPSDERFGVTSQIRRAASSIPANMAEGQARRYKKEFLQFLADAQGSLAEVETFLILSQRLGYLGSSHCNEMCSECDEIKRMLVGLTKSLEART